MVDPYVDKFKDLSVLDIETGKFGLRIGYVNGSGRAFIETDAGEERVSYVNLGMPSGGLSAAYVLSSQLKRDPGLYNFGRRKEETHA
ncbi:MAG: hypothetical protein HYT71_00095 [Candidatus Aenigmarchaeota archaeon]|nr:hypothetical protein [Candidatus Aenigmarchaeota archaeon]